MSEAMELARLERKLENALAENQRLRDEVHRVNGLHDTLLRELGGEIQRLCEENQHLKREYRARFPEGANG